MHKDLDDVEYLDDHDVCIIGSGPAGLAVASKLLGEHIKFIILESGDVDTNPKYRELNEGYSKGSRKLDLTNSRLRCFGGAGKLWAGVCRPFDPEEFDSEGGPLGGWPISYAEVVGFYKQAALILGIKYENFFNDDWKLYANLAVKFNEFARNNNILRGVKYLRASSNSRDLSNIYQEKLFTDKNCTVLTNATVVDLVQSDKNVVGHVVVKSFAGKKISVKAKHFVLCGGAIENPRIILDSSLNLEIKSNKFIGACFMSHPAFRGSASLIKNGILGGCDTGDNLEGDFGFEMTALEREKSNTLRHNISLGPSTGENVSKQQLSMAELVMENVQVLINYSKRIQCKLLGRRVDAKYWNIDIGIEQEPRMSNYVKLANSKDRHGKSKVEVFWSAVSSREMKTTLEAAKAVGREAMITNTGICKVSDELLSKEIFSQNDAINHHIGTTRMAVSSEFGVVDSNLKVFGLSNLFISGSSVFPTSSVVNPTYTIIALSLRLGEFIRLQVK